MATGGEQRISVMRRDRMVPLLPGPAPRQRLEQPWSNLLLERHSVEAIEIPEHEHHDFCLHLQLSGTPELEWWSEGRNRIESTAPGSLILLAAGTRDRLRWSDRSERLVLSVRAGAFKRAAEELGGKSHDFSNQWALRDPALRNVLLEMAREADEAFPLGRLYADLLELDLASTLLRRHAAEPFAAPIAAGGLPRPTLRRVLEFMTANLHRDLRLEEIAHEAGLSPFHFARSFRAATGQTPHQYLLDQRIAAAKQLLRFSHAPVQEVALQTGFNSPAAFIRAFRTRVNTTPGEWKARA